MRYSKTKFIVTCLVFFMLGFSLVLPILTKQEPVSAEDIGFTGTGDTWVGMVSGRVRAFKDGVSSDGTVSKGYAYMKYDPSSCNAKMAIYDEDSNLLGVSSEEALSSGGGWVEFDFSDVGVSGGEDIYVSVFASSASAYIRYDSTTGTSYYQSSLTYPNFPDPASFTSYSPQSICVYVVNVENRAWQTVSSGYFSLKNTSSVKSISTGYFTLLNSSSFGTITSGYFSFQNSASFQSISSGYFSFSNASSLKSITSGWFKFQSDRAFYDVSSGWFKFYGARELFDVSTGYFIFSNGSSWKTLFLSFSEKLYEYNDVYDAIQSIYSTYWKSQGFQVGAVAENTTYTLTAVGLRLLNIGSPTGYLTVGLRAIDPVTKKPTGADLSTGTLLASSVSGPPYAWHKISMTPYTLSPGASYCIVFRLPSGDVSNYLRYAYATSSNPYPGGANAISSSSGSTWTVYATRDAEFRVYGRVAGTFDHTWFTFQNTATYKSVTSGYFRFGNSSSFQSIASGWFTIHAVREWTNINTGWFSLSNVTSFKTLSDGWFNFTNGTSWADIDYGWFSLANSSSFQEITSGWFNFTNISSTKILYDGWFEFSHVPLWRNINSGYFTFRNVSTWVTLSSGWFRFENASNATPVVKIISPKNGATESFITPFLVRYSVYSSKKENVNVSIQVLYKGVSGWVNISNCAMNSNEYWYNTTADIATIMATLGLDYDYNTPYFLNISATNVVTSLMGDQQASFRLRDVFFDMIVLLLPLVFLIFFSILAFWKQSQILAILVVFIAILYGTAIALTFHDLINQMYTVVLLVYALIISIFMFKWRKRTSK